jgi:hypothetical protein
LDSSLVKIFAWFCLAAASGAAEAFYVLFLEPLVDEAGGAAYTGIYLDRRYRTVQGTGATLHAGVPVGHPDSLSVPLEHLVRTDFQTPAAAYAKRLIQLQGRNSFQIPESFHRIASIV